MRRGKIRSEAIDNYLVSANMHLSEHGAEYYTARDEAIAEMHRLRDVKSRTGFIDGRASTVSLLLNVELNAFCAKLPKTGRLQYNSKDMAKLRPDIDRIAELLIHSDARVSSAHKQMLSQLARVKKEVEDLSAEGKLGYLQGVRMSAADVAAAMGDGPTRNKNMPIQLIDTQKVDYYDRLENDYKARIGNIVLSMCKDILTSQKRDERRYISVNDKHRKIRAKHWRWHRSKVIASAQSAIYAACSQDSANFLKTVHEHERDIENEKWQESHNN